MRGGPGHPCIPSAADIADAAFTGATLLTPELLGSLLGATVEAAEVRDYLGRWEAECSTNSLRTPTIGENPRPACTGVGRPAPDTSCQSRYNTGTRFPVQVPVPGRPSFSRYSYKERWRLVVVLCVNLRID